MDSIKDSTDTQISSSKWEMYYSELCRRIDHQIEENDRLEEQSLFILRIVLASIGTILTALSIIISTGNLSSFQSLPTSQINSVSTEVAQLLPIIGKGQTELVSACLLSIFVWFGVSSVYNLFIRVPRHAYNVIEPSILEPSSEGTKMEVLYNENIGIENFRRTLVEEYSNIADSNKESLMKTRSEWEICYSSLRVGTRNFGIAVLFAISVIILQEPAVTILLVIMIIASWTQRASFEDVYSQLEPYLFIDIRTDTSISIFILSLLLIYRRTLIEIPANSKYYTALALIMAITLFAIPIAPYFRSPSFHSQLLSRTTGLLLLVILIWFIADLATEGPLFFEYRMLDETLSVFIVCLFISSVEIAVSLLIRKSVIKIRGSKMMDELGY